MYNHVYQSAIYDYLSLTSAATRSEGFPGCKDMLAMEGRRLSRGAWIRHSSCCDSIGVEAKSFKHTSGFRLGCEVQDNRGAC